MAQHASKLFQEPIAFELAILFSHQVISSFFYKVRAQRYFKIGGQNTFPQAILFFLLTFPNITCRTRADSIQPFPFLCVFFLCTPLRDTKS